MTQDQIIDKRAEEFQLLNNVSNMVKYCLFKIFIY